jgi:hypothetical protein
LQQQRTDLQGVLRQAEAQGNMGLVQDLTDQLAELEVAVRENTRAEFQSRVEEVNAETGFHLGVNDLNKQILELEGAISGNTNQTALLSGLQERQLILTSQRQQLEALLAEAQAANDQQAVRDLTTAVLENRVATLQNTQAINELSGTVNEPQSFSSSAWTLFREAIFTGMGQVLPQYQVPMMQTGGIAMRAGVYHLEPGEVATPGDKWDQLLDSINKNAGGDINIEVNEAGGPIDYTHLGATVAFARKHAQS